MVESILNAVTKQLGTHFGDGYRYYLETVEQGLEKPCFTVDALLPLIRSKSPTLYDRTMPIVIHYFTGDKTNTKKDCHRIAERLIECLEYLPIENKLLRGEDISWHMVEDDVLQVFITYKFTTRKVTDNVDSMEEAVGTNVSTN